MTNVGKLSLILPAHNEEPNLERVVGHSIEVLDQTMPDWEMIIVDDGSVDETPRIADMLAARDSRIRVVHHPKNRGYGSSWRSGFEAARGEYLMCMDSDGQFDLVDIGKLLPYINHYDVVAGYRIDRKDPAHRKINAAIFHVAARVLFGIHMKDLDCGFKIFRGNLIRSLPLQSPGALINLEIFSMSKLRNVSVVEVGVNHYPRVAGTPTGAKLSVVLQAMLEIMLLRLRVWRERLVVGRALGKVAGFGAGVAAAGALLRVMRRR